MSPEVEPAAVLDPGPRLRPRQCKIADALSVVGDRWSLLVIRELDFGVTRFGEIRVNTGAPREILTARLRKLEEQGVIARRLYNERPPRYEYVLTEAGEALQPVLAALKEWGTEYAASTSGRTGHPARYPI